MVKYFISQERRLVTVCTKTDGSILASGKSFNIMLCESIMCLASKIISRGCRFWIMGGVTIQLREVYKGWSLGLCLDLLVHYLVGEMIL